jgi:hypothetical protein
MRKGALLDRLSWPTIAQAPGLGFEFPSGLLTAAWLSSGPTVPGHGLGQSSANQRRIYNGVNPGLTAHSAWPRL